MKLGRELIERMRGRGFVTATEASKLASVSPATMRRWGEKILVTTTRVNKAWFFSKDSVIQFAGIEESRQ